MDEPNDTAGPVAIRATNEVVALEPLDTLGTEEPVGRPRAATLEERPDSAGQGAG
jgi:hypothetical protein